jgi:uncharacterized DUF497 family protein
MNRPIVGFDVAHAARDFEKKGIKFHKAQMIAIYGHLRY